MKKTPVCFPLLLSVLLGHLLIVCAEAQEQEWQELKSDHFVVYFVNDEKFAKEVSRKSEYYYKRIASELGYQRHSGFWTWDNRVRVFLYPDRDSFLKNTGQPDWSEGVANYTNKSISSYVWSEEFLDALLPHEMTHLIFRDYVGFTGEIPLWLDEGVAQWMEPKKRELVKVVVKRLADQNRLFTVDKIMTMDIRDSHDGDTVGAFYVQAVSLVSFLATKYGTTRFTTFCRQLRDGKTVEEALTFAYPTSIRGIDDLQEKWLQHINGG